MTENPFISIITATYNAAEFLPEYFSSLLRQSYKNFEIVAQDACSKDNTKDIIKSFSNKFNINFESEKDEGIYDAWNKAIQRARGKWLIFLGADDFFYNESSLEKIAAILESSDTNKEFMLFATVQKNSQTNDSFTTIPSENLYQNLKWHKQPHFPGILTRKEVFHKHTFDIRYKVAGDYDFLLKAVTPHNYTVNDMIVVTSLYGGVSNTFSMQYKVTKEVVKILNEHNLTTPLFKMKILVKSFILSFIARMTGEKNTFNLLKIVKRKKFDKNL